jgi:peroxiredoxin
MNATGSPDNNPDPRLSRPDLRPAFEAAEQRWVAHWLAGPTRRTWPELPPQVGDPAPDFALLDTNGREVRLSSLWRGGPALLLFWRHWGCGCGTDRAELLREQFSQLVEAGANVTVIGLGDPARAAWYAETFALPCPVLVDADESAYRDYGLLETSPWIINGEPIEDRRELEAIILRHRRRGRPVADNPFLLPGEFVIDRLGRMAFTYRYAYCDNYPDIETLVDAIKEANAAT